MLRVCVYMNYEKSSELCEGLHEIFNEFLLFTKENVLLEFELFKFRGLLNVLIMRRAPQVLCPNFFSCPKGI